jgi:hypothetical protein
MKSVDSRLLERLFIREVIIDIDEQPLEFLIWGDINDLSRDNAFSIGEIERTHNRGDVYFGIKYLYKLEKDIDAFIKDFEKLETDIGNYNEFDVNTSVQGTITIVIKDSKAVVKSKKETNILRFVLNVYNAKHFLSFIKLIIEKHEDNNKTA